MAVADNDMSNKQPHVPAWKRLGLKLKFAKETAEPSGAANPTPLAPSSAETTRAAPSIQSGDFENARPSKKRKTSSRANSSAEPTSSSLNAGGPPGEPIFLDAESGATKASVETTDPSIAFENSPGTNGSVKSSSNSEGLKRLKRRKSVTFSGETKQEDGNSAKSFANPNADAESKNIASETPGPPGEGVEVRKKSKKSARPPASQNQEGRSTAKKNKKALKDDSRPADAPEYVRYLTQSHQDRTSWKFNKNLQNSLLKNIFNIRTVPPSLTPAAVEYVEGLQGAGPRQRLSERATEILKPLAEKAGLLDDSNAMNTESGRRKVYAEAVGREWRKLEEAGAPHSEYDDEMLREMEEKAERFNRAEALLTTLSQSEPAAHTTVSSMPTTSLEAAQDSSLADTKSANTSQLTALSSRKKRKKRTGVSSSSSRSSSDSDSDDAPPAKPGPRTVTEALRPATLPKPKTKAQSPPPRTPAYQHDNLNVSYRPQNPSQLMDATAKPKVTKFFDDDTLDKVFGSKKTYNETAPKRKREDGKKGREAKRGYAYTHGTHVDESESEDD